MPLSPPVAGPRRFRCTGCGACCRRPGVVYFDADELARMAAHTGLSIADFSARYKVRWDAASRAHTVEATEEAPCPLLQDDGSCGVQPVKPAQCRTFPFWDELLDDQRAWSAAKGWCEGIDDPEGRLYAIGEMRALRRGRGATD